MRSFSYKALKPNGEVIEATCEGESRADVLARFKIQGLVAVNLNEVRSHKSKNAKVPAKTISRFYAMLSNQLQVGVPMLSALELIAREERSVEGKKLIDNIARSVEAGQSLSSALQSHEDAFPIVDLNLVRAGEEGGFLPDAIDRICQIREWQQKLIANAWGAAAYPLMLVSIAALLIPAMLIYLVPKLEPIFASLRRDSQLPFATSLLLSISHLCQEYGLQLLLGVLFAILLLSVFAPKEWLLKTRDKLILKTPVIGELVRDFVLARFFRVLGTLLQNKIQVLTSLDIAVKVLGNRELTRSFQQLHGAIASGKMLADSLDKTRQIPTDVLAMIGVAEQSNSLDSVLVKIATQLESRTNRRLETIVKMIEPMLLLFMAAFVGFVVLALLLPIFEGQSLG